MTDISTEKRLQLVQQIRREHIENTQKLRQREHILYGNGDIYEPTIPANIIKTNPLQTENEEQQLLKTEKKVNFSTFGIRLLLATLLFLGYLYLSKENITIGKLNAEVIRSEVNRYRDADINLFDFMEDITYTLNIDNAKE